MGALGTAWSGRWVAAGGFAGRGGSGSKGWARSCAEDGGGRGLGVSGARKGNSRALMGTCAQGGQGASGAGGRGGGGRTAGHGSRRGAARAVAPVWWAAAEGEMERPLRPPRGDPEYIVKTPSWQRHGTGCRPSRVRILPYRRLRLHGGGALVVWPGMLLPSVVVVKATAKTRLLYTDSGRRAGTACPCINT